MVLVMNNKGASLIFLNELVTVKIVRETVKRRHEDEVTNTTG